MIKQLLALVGALLVSTVAFGADQVNLNTATQTQIEAVAGVGPTKAKAIVDYRTKNGSFKSVDELDNVTGFGKKTVEKVKGGFTVSNAQSSKAAASKSKN